MTTYCSPSTSEWNFALLFELISSIKICYSIKKKIKCYFTQSLFAVLVLENSDRVPVENPLAKQNGFISHSDRKWRVKINLFIFNILERSAQFNKGYSSTQTEDSSSTSETVSKAIMTISYEVDQDSRGSDHKFPDNDAMQRNRWSLSDSRLVEEWRPFFASHIFVHKSVFTS